MQIRAKHTTNSKQKDPTSILLAQKQCVVSDFCFVTHFCSVDLCYLQMFLSYAPKQKPNVATIYRLFNWCKTPTAAGELHSHAAVFFVV